MSYILDNPDRVFELTLEHLQLVFTAILIAESEATERFSSRLRSVIMVFAAGGILVFAGVSLGRWAEEHGPRRRPQGRSKHAKTD